MLTTKLVAARKAKGWTIRKAAGRTLTVHHHALKKLETGETDPQLIHARTMVELINLYPELTIADFLGDEIAKLLVAIIKRPRGRPRKDTTC